MKQENHSKGYFQKQYISTCEQIGEPLTEKQISALESTISKMFSLPITNSTPSGEISEKFDNLCLYKLKGVKSRVATELINNLLSYAANVKHIENPELNMTNDTALEFYNGLFSRTIQQLEHRDPPLKLRVGKQQTESLAKYLLTKGKITKQEFFTLPSR